MTGGTEKIPVGIVGAGAMGAGIAQVAATNGHAVALVDTSPAALMRARASLETILAKLVAKGALDQESAQALMSRIAIVDSLSAISESGLVIEAIVEDAAVKQEEFSRIENIVREDCLIATNTSSLAITALAAGLHHPERFLGIHFFNPAPLMPLVEIIPGLRTGEAQVRAARSLIDAWGKVTVLARDTPGFIVNRVARPFYTEALAMLEEGIADSATIDWAMREHGGFRMGPFELMDLIGNDINATVTATIWSQMFYDPAFRPSLIQQRLVEAGFFGRKCGRGFYSYKPETPRPEPQRDETVGRAICDRIISLLINGAAEALRLKVAGRDDLDRAMTHGVNYPKGLLRWADDIGIDTVLARLDALFGEYHDRKYAPSPLLVRMAREKRTFH
jgi:3-hydroxybutyryl-CoA dehydrogenase